MASRSVRLILLAFVAAAGVVLALGIKSARSSPPCWSNSPNRPSSCPTTTAPTVESTTTTQTTTTPTGGLYVDHDPASGVFAPWQRFQVGGTSYYVSDYPTGISTTGTIDIVDDPLGQEGKAFHLKTTSTSNFVSSNGNETLDRTDVWQNNGVSWNAPGYEIWEHFKLMFPFGQQFNTTGSTFLFQHHNGGGGFSIPGDGLFLAVVTGPLRFYVGYYAGAVGAGGFQFNYIRQVTIETGVWYDIVFHVKWSTGSDGLVQWFVDGTKALDRAGPTLAYSGTLVDRPNYEFSCYRHHATFDQHCYFGRLKIGATQAAVQ